MRDMVVPTTEGQTRLSAGGTGNEEESFQKQCPSECVRLLGKRSPIRGSPPKLVWTPPFDLDLAWGPGKGHLLTDSYKDLVTSSCPQSCWQGCASPQQWCNLSLIPPRFMFLVPITSLQLFK